MLVYSLTFRSRTFHSYWDVTVFDEELLNLGLGLVPANFFFSWDDLFRVKLAVTRVMHICSFIQVTEPLVGLYDKLVALRNLS